MKIIITESQLRAIDEELGVPTNILNISFGLSQTIIEETQKLTKSDFFVSAQGGKRIGYNADFNVPINGKIGDMDLKNIHVTIELVEQNMNQDFIMASLAYRSGAYFDDNYKIRQVQSKGQVSIVIEYYIKKDWSFAGLKKITEDIGLRKNNLTSSVAHELKHAYDTYMGKHQDPKKRMSYKAYSEDGNTGVPSMNRFMTMMYYCHKIESTVRATEVAARAMENGVTKSNFLDFLKKDNTYRQLKSISNYKYEDLIKGLISDMNIIDQILIYLQNNRKTNTEYYSPGWDNTKKINKFFEVTQRRIKSSMKEDLIYYMENDDRSVEYREKKFPGKDEKYVEKFNQNRASAYFDKNPEKFIQHAIRGLNREANAMIKKISKLYAMMLD